MNAAGNVLSSIGGDRIRYGITSRRVIYGLQRGQAPGCLLKEARLLIEHCRRGLVYRGPSHNATVTASNCKVGMLALCKLLPARSSAL